MREMGGRFHLRNVLPEGDDGMNRVNCWEYKKCRKEKECPAYPNHGRICFSVTGTVCLGEVQGTYQEKIKMCRERCTFYIEELSA
jgi:hypothetical protein